MTDVEKFILAYEQWLEDGAPDLYPFSRNTGLCFNFCYVFSGAGSPNLAFFRTFELRKLFAEDFLSADHPFNSSINAYIQECANPVCHLNKERVAWVKKRANALRESGKAVS